MADRLELGVDADPSQIRQVETALDDVGKAATSAGAKLDDAGDALDVTDALIEISNLRGEMQELRDQLDAVESELRDVEDAGNDAGKAVKKAGDDGGKSTGGMSLKVISLNQALELGKKAVQALSQTIDALATNGSPAFVRLREELDATRESLFKIADDPRVQAMIDSVTGSIQGDLNPAIESIPDVMEQSFVGMQGMLLDLKRLFGLVGSEARDQFKSQYAAYKQAQEQAAEAIKAKREELNVTKAVADLRAKVASDGEMQRLAAVDSEQTLKSLIEDQIDAMREAEKAGTATAKTREADLRKIELMERRLIELPAQRQAAELKAQEAASQARADAMKEFGDNIKAMGEQAAAAQTDIIDKKIAEAQAVVQQLVATIQNAKGTGGQNLLDTARGSISPEAVRNQLIKQAQGAARQKVIDAGQDSGKVDQFGKAIGNTSAERAAAQRQLERQQDMASRQAGVDTFRNFNAGKTSQADVAGAQNALIQGAAQQAQASGQLGAGIADAMTQVLNVQQQSVMDSQQTAARIQQLEQFARSIGSTIQNTRARAQSGGFRR